MLLMKNWLETRWRLTAVFGYLILFLAINYRNQQPGMKVSNLLFPLWMILTFGVLTLAGGGVKTQSPAGFPAGLAESTQFTLALPVSRLRLAAVRVASRPDGDGGRDGNRSLRGLELVSGIACQHDTCRSRASPSDHPRVADRTLLLGILV